MSVQFIEMVQGRPVYYKQRIDEMIQRLELPPDSRVVVVASVGATKTGKSTILNAIVASSQNEGPVGSDDMNCCFQAAPGLDRATSGMWIWIKPEPIRENTYLVLIDTGDILLDPDLFSISALVSSHLIYNINRGITESDLERIDLMTECTRLTSYRKYHAFQTLCFMVHDWQHFTDRWSVERVVKESRRYLDRVMNMEDVNNYGRKRIQANYHLLECGCLPYPGIQFAETGGGDLRTNFLESLSRLAHRTIDSAPSKSVFGKPVLLGELGEYVENCLELVKKDKNNELQAGSEYDALTKGLWFRLQYELIQKYSDQIQEYVSTIDNSDRWKTQHQKYKREADNRFNGRMVLGSNRVKMRYQKALLNQIDLEYQRVVENVNRARRWSIFSKLGLILGVVMSLSRMVEQVCDHYFCDRLITVGYNLSWGIWMILLMRLLWFIYSYFNLNGRIETPINKQMLEY